MDLLTKDVTVKVKYHPLMKPLQTCIKNALYTIAEGGRYGGKTYTCAMVALIDGIRSKTNFVIVCIAPEQQMLETGLKQNMRKIIDDFGIANLIVRDNASRLVLDFGDHTVRIGFKYGSSRPERLLKSMAFVNRFVIDEGQLYPFLFFDYARGTLREEDGKIIIMANLNHEDSWVYYMCRKDGAIIQNESYRKILEKKGKINACNLYGVFRMPYYSNPFLPENILDMIESYRTSPDPVGREWYLVEIMNQLPSHHNTLIFPPELFDYTEMTLQVDHFGRRVIVPQHTDKPYVVTFKRGIDFGGTSQGTGHNGAIVECFFVEYDGIDKYGRKGKVTDLYVYSAVIKQMPENVDYLREIDKRTTWFEDKLLGKMDKTRAGALNQFKRGEIGYPSLSISPASQGRDSVEDSNFFLRSLNKIWINLNAEVDEKTGRRHCDNISYEIRNYRYQTDKDTGLPKKENGVLKVRKLDDDFFSALRYAVDDEFLAYKRKKEKKLSPYKATQYYDNINQPDVEHNHIFI